MFGIDAIGSQWAAQRFVGDEHNPDSFAFQNLQSGQVVGKGLRRDTTYDLNSPGLLTKVCSPLTVPSIPYQGFTHVLGSLTPIGAGYEIAAGVNTYLERCGTNLHIRVGAAPITFPGCAALACPPAFNKGAIVWQGAPGDPTLYVIFMPSRKKFRIPIPPRVDQGRAKQVGTYEVALTKRTLYFSTFKSVWSAPAPTPPKPRRGTHTIR